MPIGIKGLGLLWPWIPWPASLPGCCERSVSHFCAAPGPSRDPAVLASYRERFSFATVGGRYRARLEELGADREGVGARLRWRGAGARWGGVMEAQ